MSLASDIHELARGWRNEHPRLRVTTFVVGPTITDFANGWDAELAGEMFARWSVEGYPEGAAMDPGDMAEQVLRVLASGARIDEVVVMPDPEDVTDRAKAAASERRGPERVGKDAQKAAAEDDSEDSGEDDQGNGDEHA